MLERWLLFWATLWLPCAQGEPLKALVYERADKWTNRTGAATALQAQGFQVEPLTAETPLQADLIVFGSFANTDREYRALLKARQKELTTFVENGGVLLEMAQEEGSGDSPAFLPKDMRAVRGDASLGDVRLVAKDHPLFEGLGKSGMLRLPAYLGQPPSWQTFMNQKGGAVVLAAGPGVNNPVFLEAAHGRGRFLLTSLFFDKTRDSEGKEAAPKEYTEFSAAFFKGLARYVREVRSGKAAPVAVTPLPAPPPFPAGAWTIVVLPDTQVYARRHPELFEAQIEWIRRHAKDRNIRYVLHLGDITNNNNAPQWEVAKRAMSRLDGVVPYALVGGNHDYGPDGKSANRETLLNEYFPLSLFEKWPTFGGAMEPGKIDNTFHCFEAGGEKWIVLALEWSPRDQVVEWANRVLDEHPDHRGILITHAYLTSFSQRYDYAKYGEAQAATPHHYPLSGRPEGVNDGEELWQKLVSRHPNMVMTINGHDLQDGVGRLSSTGVQGNTVHQMLANYQVVNPQGGNGLLRLYEFLPGNQTVQVRTYSPALDEYLTDVQNQFTLDLSERAK